MRTVPYSAKNIRLFLAVLWLLAAFFTVKKDWSDAGRWIWAGGEAAVIGFFFAFPKLFFPVYRLLMIGSSFIGQTVFLIISVLVFVLFLTPLSALKKLFGRAPIPVAYDPKAPTYFEPPDPEGSAERQF